MPDLSDDSRAAFDSARTGIADPQFRQTENKKRAGGGIKSDTAPVAAKKSSLGGTVVAQATMTGAGAAMGWLSAMLNRAWEEFAGVAMHRQSVQEFAASAGRSQQQAR
jgi:hypothetical protein